MVTRVRALAGFLLVLLAVLLAVAAGMVVVDASRVRAERFQLMPDDPDRVLDRTLGLVWARCPLGTKLEGQASGLMCQGPVEQMNGELAQAVAQRFASFGQPWRLPTVRELSSLAAEDHCCPALDPAIFPAFGLSADQLQTSAKRFEFHTASSAGNGRVWRVDGTDGRVTSIHPSWDAAVRLVRTATPEELSTR